MSKRTRLHSELSIFEWGMLEEWKKANRRVGRGYDHSVRVGTGVETESIEEKWLKKCIRANSRLKIDCVVFDYVKPVMIIEVKRVAAVGSIGQLAGYKYLYDMEYKSNVGMLLLCKFASDDVKLLCDRFGIKVEIL